MVFFTCNVCGESLKKNQVEKHYQTTCRNCSILSCVDCGKDFHGDDYQKHIKCISEDEKYSGKTYKPKPNQNKGEVRQDKWLQQVHRAMDKASGNLKLQNLLSQLQNYSNIPRKRAKFENFVKNSMRVYDSKLVSQVWEIMSSTEDLEKEPKEKRVETTDEVIQNEVVNDSDDDTDVIHRKSKRQKKMDRRNKVNKKEKKDKSKAKFESPDNTDDVIKEEVGVEEKREKKKRKRKGDESSGTDCVEAKKPKRIKKKENRQDKMTTSDEETLKTCRLNETLDVDENINKKSLKFNWEAVIVKVLQKTNGNELPIKKLRKKVLAEYMAQKGQTVSKPDNKILAKFEKKIAKNPSLKLHKERVKLKC